MASRIEQQILDIEQYIDECKYVTFSSNKVAVDKDKLLDMLGDLRDNLPEEMAKYRQVVSERQRILDEARARAKQLVDETTARTNKLVSNQEIMQQAYAQAEEIVAMSSQRAQQIEDDAIQDANNYRMAAIQYMEQLLAQLDRVTRETQKRSQETYDSYAKTLAQYVNTIYNNRVELRNTQMQQLQPGAGVSGQQAGSATAEIRRSEIGVPESQTGNMGGLSLDGAR